MPNSDAVASASNALNDKKIRETVQTGLVRDAMQEFLEREGDLLSFHQLGLASLFEFLPEALKLVRAGVDVVAAASPGVHRGQKLGARHVHASPP
ncbi:MAG: hypothetical protein ACRDRI_19320 [Pseudonocardiaceae bacterium]